jgi:hypothetical protein
MMGYLTFAAHNKVQPIREVIESWWKQFKPYADPNFPLEFQANLAQPSWELYVGITLLGRGFGLGPSRPGQPDLPGIRCLPTFSLLATNGEWKVKIPRKFAPRVLIG